MKLLTDANEYGLRAVIWLAQHPGESFKVKELALHIDAAPGYLIKVLQSLTKSGILSARRGNRGGFTLQADPDRLTALDIIDAIDGFERIEECPMSHAAHRSSLCPLHRHLELAIEQLEEGFRQLTIGDVLQQPLGHDLHCDELSARPYLPAYAAEFSTSEY